MVDQVIQPWAEYQMTKVDQAAEAYDRRKAPPNSTHATHMAQQGNQRFGDLEMSTNAQAGEMITNAGTQQQWMHNSGAVTNWDTDALLRNSQATTRNIEWQNQQGQQVPNTFNAQAPTAALNHNAPQMFTQGWPQGNSNGQYNAAQINNQGQQSLMEQQIRGFRTDAYNDPMRQYQQNDHNYNIGQRWNDTQIPTGNIYAMAQNYGPGPQDVQFGPMRGVLQQPFVNHRPSLHLDYPPGPSWLQGQQYDTQRMYPPMPPPNYYPHTHAGGAFYNGDPQWTMLLGHYPPYPLPLASGKMAKMLHGSNRDHLLGFYSRSAHEDVTEIFVSLTVMKTG